MLPRTVILTTGKGVEEERWGSGFVALLLRVVACQSESVPSPLPLRVHRHVGGVEEHLDCPAAQLPEAQVTEKAARGEGATHSSKRKCILSADALAGGPREEFCGKWAAAVERQGRKGGQRAV